MSLKKIEIINYPPNINCFVTLETNEDAVEATVGKVITSATVPYCITAIYEFLFGKSFPIVSAKFCLNSSSESSNPSTISKKSKAVTLVQLYPNKNCGQSDVGAGEGGSVDEGVTEGVFVGEKDGRDVSGDSLGSMDGREEIGVEVGNLVGLGVSLQMIGRSS